VLRFLLPMGRCASSAPDIGPKPAKPRGDYPILDVPEGTSEWLLRAARYYDGMGCESASDFVLWASVDLREVA
jgi:hypothetical protein